MITIPLAAAQIAAYSAAGALVLALLIYGLRGFIADKRAARFCRYHWSCKCARTVRTERRAEEVFA